MVKLQSVYQRTCFWLSLLLSLCALPSQAADLVASVSKNSVVNNEVIQLRIVSSSKLTAEAVDFSQLEPDFFVGQPSFASSTNIINGNYSQRSEWTVAIAPQRSGILTIPSFQIGSAHSAAIAIQVSEDEQQPEPQELAEVRSQLEQTQLYPGESTLFHAQLIIKQDIRRLRDPQITPPQVDGMQIEAASEPKQSPSLLNGVEVTIVEQSFRITAQQAGRFSLREPMLKANLLYGNQYSGTRLIPLLTQPKSYPIQVLAQPANYQGAWLPSAHLSLSQSWLDGQQRLSEASQYQTEVGRSITREIRLQVRGLTQQQIPTLHIQYPDSISLYPEKPQFSTLENGDTLMTLKQVLIPRHAGEITLPDVTLNWWNTQTHMAQTSQLAGLTLQVKASDEAPLFNMPTVPDLPTSQPVSDTGYWPYLTLLFALLWLATTLLALLMWRGSRVVSQPSINHDLATSSTYRTLIEAIEQQDLLAISQAIRIWQTEITLPSNEQQTLHQLLDTLQQACYGKQSQQPDFKPLQRWVKLQHKQQLSSVKPTASKLAQL
ncbi:BatD family protein [Vibrio misgurnus]|uniref:BatD family protein n=1 Tax=Vibrio TaxID=662 RepID=UPI002417019B|nr:BatD family protein [Vibrio sp. gvc]